MRCRAASTSLMPILWETFSSIASFALLSCRKNSPCDFAESNAKSVLMFAPAGHRHAVAVLDAGSPLAVGQFDRLRAFPGQLEHAAEAVGRRAADRAAGQHVARAQITAVDRVVRELLRHAPVHVPEV